jgi:hypothetical protein
LLLFGNIFTISKESKISPFSGPRSRHKMRARLIALQDDGVFSLPGG